MGKIYVKNILIHFVCVFIFCFYLKGTWTLNDQLRDFGVSLQRILTKEVVVMKEREEEK